jgi:hypothetical protein
MIARKDSPVWTRLSRFGVPHAPFDYNSGYGTVQVKRSECVKLGVIAQGERVGRPVPQAAEEEPETTRPVGGEETMERTIGKNGEMVNPQIAKMGTDLKPGKLEAEAGKASVTAGVGRKALPVARRFSLLGVLPKPKASVKGFGEGLISALVRVVSRALNRVVDWNKGTGEISLGTS